MGAGVTRRRLKGRESIIKDKTLKVSLEGKATVSQDRGTQSP